MSGAPDMCETQDRMESSLSSNRDRLSHEHLLVLTTPRLSSSASTHWEMARDGLSTHKWQWLGTTWLTGRAWRPCDSSLGGCSLRHLIRAQPQEQKQGQPQYPITARPLPAA